MKKWISTSLVLAALTVGIFSCQKSVSKPESEKNPPITAEQSAALSSSIRTYYENKIASTATGRGSGSAFIVPFFSIEAWGFFKYDPNTQKSQLVFFVAELGDGDFYRENPDGTVSVHINCHDAEIFYIPDLDDPNFTALTGTGGRYSSNYTGPVIEFESGFKIIDTENLRNAAVTGSGKVSLEGTAPWYTLMLKFLTTPSGRIETEFSVR